VEIAESREAEVVHIWHLLDALVAEDESEVSALLASVGADLSRLREELARDPFAGVRPTGT
jgi:ATP-dependent Clp protease ATP-binding subunit ClpA